MGKLTGTISNIRGKYFSLQMNGAGKRRLHVDSNHSLKAFGVGDGDVVSVTLHPIEINAVVLIEKK